MINVNPKSSKPLYEQIVDSFKELVIKNILKEGDLIPSVRKLALMIEVNPNTISKAYKELERQKIFETVQGKGTFVAKINNKTIDKEKLELIKDNLKTLLIELKYLNLDDKQIIKLVEEVLDYIKS